MGLRAKWLGAAGVSNRTEQYGFVKVLDDVKAIKLGEFHSLIIKTDNSLWAAGDNDFGELVTGDKIAHTNLLPFGKVIPKGKLVNVALHL